MAFTRIDSDTAPARNEERVLAQRSDWRKQVTVFVLLLALCWLSLYAASAALPMVKSGAMIIYDAKFDRLVAQPMFAPSDKTRIMMFGNSRVVSGFRPAEFDAALGPGTRSYNLGLPGEPLFLPMLEAALAAGNVPTHVILTIAWDDKTEARTLLDRLRDDNAIVNRLLPFRVFLRDLVLFSYNNRFRFAEGLRHATSQRDLMIEDRGWYFIKWQSHFLNDQLPDGFAIPTDRPNQASPRELPARSLVRDRLMQLAKQHNFQIVLVPASYRAGEFAPAPAADADRDALVSASPLVRIIGPDHWTYPTSYFADPVHLNPPGALAYTADLAALFRKHLAQ
jgi:hypothetical protein